MEPHPTLSIIEAKYARTVAHATCPHYPSPALFTGTFSFSQDPALALGEPTPVPLLEPNQALPAQPQL